MKISNSSEKLVKDKAFKSVQIKQIYQCLYN